MNSHGIDLSRQRAARIAGFCLVFAMAIVVFGEFAISSKLLVPGNAAETARNILAHPTLFRLDVVCDLVYVVNVAILIAALDMILRPIHRGLASAAALFRLVYALMWVLIALNMLGALRFLDDSPALRAFDAERLQALARLSLRASFDNYYVGLPFFALASTLVSYLWLKSRYIPKILAAFGLLASAWGVACAFAFLLFPAFNRIVNDWWFDTPLGLFELTTGLWLLFKGLRPPEV